MSNGDLIRYKKWQDVPNHLMSKSKLKEKGLKPGPVRATVYQRMNRKYINLYDINEATPKIPPTEAQIESLRKARKKYIEYRTCPICGFVNRKRLDGRLCDDCEQQMWLNTVAKEAKKVFTTWVNGKKNYIILDIETTGMGGEDEIIQIAFINLDGQCLFNSMVKPKKPIPDESTRVHGITNQDVAGSPLFRDLWPDILPVLKSKIILAYNAPFDERMILQTLDKYKIPYPQLSFVCVMEWYARYIGSYSDYHRDYTWVSLQDAANIEGIGQSQEHEALSDCILTLQLICSVSGKKKDVSSSDYDVDIWLN